jgi:hypothetical protein
MATETTRIFRYDDADPAAWGEFIEAMHSGERFECDEEMFYYWLEVLPPVWMGRTIEFEGGPVWTTFGFAEGYEPVTAFWREGGRLFGRRTTIMNPRAFG